ncbi:L-xylulose reductase [Armadillidium nasatum]|uniref:L-xylulose reductase n=2 Tax=Armadillidium nasatum TaxID=96803 RepID=A0A5N5TK00_9CRUS|nr:L-xylulose reductase [Armadillidium nasatum]
MSRCKCCVATKRNLISWSKPSQTEFVPFFPYVWGRVFLGCHGTIAAGLPRNGFSPYKQIMEKFQGKRALVTGASSGIGRGIALKLASLGAEVFAVARSEEALKSLEKEHSNIKTFQLDLTDWDKTRKTIESILPIHLLINNAGMNLLAPVLEATPEDFDYSFNLNVKAVMNATQVVTKDLISRKQGGRVVNISSIAGQRAIQNHLIYCSTKAAIDMLTKCFALELGPHNIRVNAVSPTVVLTELGRRGWSDPVKANAVKARIPQGRFVEVEEVVNVVIYLLSDESDMINGHSLPIEGGLLIS